MLTVGFSVLGARRCRGKEKLPRHAEAEKCPGRSGYSEKPTYAKPIVAGVSPGGFRGCEMRRTLLASRSHPAPNVSEANWTGPRGTKGRDTTKEIS